MSDVNAKPLLPYKPVIAIKPKDAFGPPKPLLNAMTKDGEGNIVNGQKATVGVIFGTARKVGMSTRTTPEGEVERRYCLEGAFESIPTNRDLHPTKAPKVWLPTHIFSLVKEALASNDPLNGTVNPNGAEAVEFSFVVGIESATRSSAGFIWTYIPTIEVKSASDPLAHLRATIPAGLLPPPPAPEPRITEDDGDGSEPEAAELEERGDERGPNGQDPEPAAAHKPARGGRHK